MHGRSRTWLLTRFLATAVMVMMYLAGTLVPSSILTSTTAQARGRGGGRGYRGGGHRGRGRGRGFRFRRRARGLYFYPGFYPGVGSCSYWSSACGYRWGWGTGAWYRCMWRHGC
jgi:hypothetical protein